MAADPSDVPHDCVSCAACCFSQLETHVRVSGDDYERLGDGAASWVQFDGYRAFMRMVDGHCRALLIDARRGTFACTVYPQRPQTCRDLGRGTPECRGEVDAKADRPRRALRLAGASGAPSFGQREPDDGAQPASRAPLPSEPDVKRSDG